MSDTNKSFEDYFSNNFEDGLSSPSKYILRFTYEAGQQSRQAKIDELKVEVERLKGIIKEALDVYDKPMCDETALYQRDDDIWHILTENKFN